jgi:hypothetical protein
MKRQVIFIHGGDPHDSYKQYIDFLRNFRLDFERALGRGWRGTLQKKLGKKFEVIAPRMPNSLNAKYLEWEIWFKKFIPHMEKEVILGGHSLGGIFLAQYLSENKFPKKIRGLFLVAPPFKGNNGKDPMADFILPKDISQFTKYGEKIHLYHSEDDKLVWKSDFNRYVEAIPNAQVRVFKNRGHFLGDKFPELVKDIKALYK